MNNGESGEKSLNRRQLLKGAVGTAALASAFPYLDFASAEVPDNNKQGRISENFDARWKFFKGDEPAASRLEYSDSSWRDLDLPHDWSVEGPFNENEASGNCGGYLPTGIGWYRKHFRVPESYRGKTVTVFFDGVYQNSEIWINGHSVGKRPYGYVPFFYDLTPYLDFHGNNLIAVRVDNSQQTNCRWYSGSGIYRHTQIVVTHPVHIAPWGVFVSTPQVSKSGANLEIRTAVQNHSNELALCTLISEVLDHQQNVIQSSESLADIAAGGEHAFAQQIDIQSPHLWSVEDPYLYRVRSTLKIHNQEVDSTNTTIGIRSAEFDVHNGFLLNGERVKLKGVCLHHDGGCVGAAVPERVWERRLQLLKEMGCNAIRGSHNPVASEFLDICDRLGFLVMNEAFDEWKVPKGQIGPNGYANYFDQWYEQDIQNFVRRDRNHPSVVLWSAGNEIGDQDIPEGTETLKKILAVFRAEDPTRLVTAGCDHIGAEPPDHCARAEFLALLDVVGYNYADRWRDRREKYYSIDRRVYSERRFIGTESDSICGIRGAYPELFSESIPPGDFFEPLRSRAIDVEQLCKFVGTYNYVAGDFMWTGIDHLGEARWPMKGSFTGVLDTCGFKKDGFYFYQSLWTEAPVLHLFPHWNWKGKEGQIIPVTCYTNCDTVELFLNGKSYGVKGYEFPRLGMELRYGNYPERAKVLRTTADLHLSWDVPYEPGILKAVGIRNGKVAMVQEISTAGEPYAVALSADHDDIAADGRDVVHFTVQIVDARGRLVPTSDNDVLFDLRGEGKLIGVDNGDPACHDDYRVPRRKAFGGMCLAIVQSTRKAGTIQITASSPSLKPSIATVLTKV